MKKVRIGNPYANDIAEFDSMAKAAEHIFEKTQRSTVYAIRCHLSRAIKKGTRVNGYFCELIETEDTNAIN